MKSSRAPFLIAIVVILALFAAAVFFLLSPGDQEATQPPTLGYGSGAVEALVVKILEEGQVELGDVTQDYQTLQVEILEGEFTGLKIEVDYGVQQLRPAGLNLKPGDRVFINVFRDPDNILQARFLDFRRTGPLLVLFATFVFFSVLISGWKGVRGLIGMAFSIAVILFYIIPQILAGANPILVSVSGAFLLLAVTLYLVYGWTLKTHAAVLGTFFSLVLTALLAGYFVNLTRLTGFGSEDALFLMQQAPRGINLQGIVLGGMLIGALGVLDDLVITQASVVFELFGLDPDLSFRELYRRAMRVGQDHVAATVNTLVLAYAGAALPMFLLFSLSGSQLGYLLNLEYVAEEVVRTMVGSLGLIAAVPLTTALACGIAKRSADGGGFWEFLGPATGEDAHGHGHHH